MRLILVNPNPLPSPDPESLQIIQTAAALAKSADIHLIVCRGLRESPDIYYNLSIPDSLHLHFLPAFKIYWGPFRFSWNFPFFSFCLFKVMYLARMQKADAVFIRNLKLGYFFLKWRRFYKKLPPIIFETHEIFTLSYQDEMAGRTNGSLYKEKRLAERERYVYENVDGLICITEHLANMIRERFIVRERILVAQDGVDLSLFHRDTGLLPIDQEDINIDKTILYIGSLHQWKGLDVLLKALCYLPDAYLRIAGGDHDSINRYKTLAKELKINKRVYFEGFVSPGRRFNCFRYTNVCVLPLKPVSIASYFTSPLKMFEYMASGKPIVASDLPAIREVLNNNINSILVPPDNPQALADGIKCVLDDPELKKQLSRQARLDVQEYTWDKRADKIKNFIRSIN